LIAFFATGGIDKARKALVIAKADFSTVKGQISDFQESIITKTKSGMKGQEG